MALNYITINRLLLLIIVINCCVSLASAGKIKNKLSSIIHKPLNKFHNNNYNEIAALPNENSQAAIYDGHSVISTEKRVIQAINAYLTDLDSIKLDTNSVISELKEAVDNIEKFGFETFATMTIEDLNNIGLSKFNNLLIANDPKVTVNIMNNLIMTSRSCNDESINFFTLIIEQETFDGQFLNKFSRLLLENCLKFETSTISQRIDRVIGKMKSNLFDLLGEVANIYDNITKENQTRKSGDITIREPGKTDSINELLRQLKQINLTMASKLKQYALALNRYFNRQLPVDNNDTRINLSKGDELKRLELFYNNELIQPCSELIIKVKTITKPLLEYKKIFKQLSISSILDSIRVNNKEFDYQIEIFRICTQVQDNEKQLLQMLKNMR